MLTHNTSLNTLSASYCHIFINCQYFFNVAYFVCLYIKTYKVGKYVKQHVLYIKRKTNVSSFNWYHHLGHSHIRSIRYDGNLRHWQSVNNLHNKSLTFKLPSSWTQLCMNTIDLCATSPGRDNRKSSVH